MHLEALPDAFQQCHGQLSSKMLPKFLQPCQHDQCVFRIHVEQFVRVQLETKRLQQIEHLFRGSGFEKTQLARINRVERDTDGHGFAVANLVFRELLEFMRGPVAKVQRPRGAELKRVARGCEVVQVQLSAAIDEPLHCGRVELVQRFDVPFKALEEFFVTNERHFDGFDVTSPLVARREGGEQLKVVDDREGWNEGANEVLFAEGVNAVFDTYRSEERRVRKECRSRW